MRQFPAFAALVLIFGTASQSATFNKTTGLYEGKIVMIGCHVGAPPVGDNQCYVQPEVTTPAVSERAGGATPCNSGLIRFWGKRAEGALITSLLNDAFLAGKTVRLKMSTSCFDGFPSEPAPTIDSLAIVN